MSEPGRQLLSAGSIQQGKPFQESPVSGGCCCCWPESCPRLGGLDCVGSGGDKEGGVREQLGSDLGLDQGCAGKNCNMSWIFNLGSPLRQRTIEDRVRRGDSGLQHQVPTLPSFSSSLSSSFSVQDPPLFSFSSSCDPNQMGFL